MIIQITLCIKIGLHLPLNELYYINTKTFKAKQDGIAALENRFCTEDDTMRDPMGK